MEVGKDLEVMLWYWNVHDYNHEIALLRVLRKTTESSNQHGYLAMLHLADSLQECNYQHNSASSSKYAYTLGDSGLIFSHFGLHVFQNVFNDHWIYWMSSGIFESLRVRSGCSASDRAEILMPQSLQANCNSSIHGDRWWNKRVWTSWWF